MSGTGDKTNNDQINRPSEQSTPILPAANQSGDDNDEINQLNQFIAEKKERLKWKLELKQQNQSAVNKDENQLKKLDSSIKKVTAFIKLKDKFSVLLGI